MKKIISFLFCTTLLWAAASGQAKRPPETELKAQKNHVKSSGSDLLHLRFKKAHKKHVAEAARRNRGIEKDLDGKGQALPKPKGPPPRPPIRNK